MAQREVALTTTDIIQKKGESLDRQAYFNFIRHNLNDYSALSYTPEEALSIQKHLQKLSTGSAALMPMFCAGRTMCPWADRCPLVAIGKEPIGLACYIETSLINHWVMQYMNEYDVDPSNFTEVSFCNDLAEIEVMLMRLNMSLAKPENAELIIDQTVTIGQDGTPINQKMLSPYMEQKEKLHNRKAKIIKLMVGDRQEKYKKEAALKIKNNNDPSSKQAEIRRQLDTLNRQMSKKVSELNKDNILTPDAIISSDEE